MSPSSATSKKPAHPSANPDSPPPQTIAAQFRASAALRESIDGVIRELESARARLDRVRGPLDASHEAAQLEGLRDACRVRGKDKLFFDYIGSGLGNGPFVELVDGSVKLDMINGIGVYFFGHSDPGVTRAALSGALGDTIMQGNLQANDDCNAFAQFLVEEASKRSRVEHAFISNSGAMVNEAALKVCYQKGHPAGRVLAFEHCFMGRTVTLSQIGDSAANRQGVPLTTQVDYIPFYDAESGAASIDKAARRLQEYIERYPKQHACFAFELVQGEGGYNTAPREFFTTLMDICRTNGIAVWIDEIQTFGRTSEMFAFNAFNLGEYVDVCTVGKMSQVCACLFTREFNPKAGLLSGTFTGSTVGFNAGLYMLTTLRDGGYYGPQGRIEQHYRRFIEGVRALAARRPEWFPPIIGRDGAALKNSEVAGGFGGMMRFTPFGGQKEPVFQALRRLFEEGVISFYCGHGPYHIRFLPPLGVMELAHWDAVFEVVERALGKVSVQPRKV